MENVRLKGPEPVESQPTQTANSAARASRSDRLDEVYVIIPALNEESSIGLVLGDLPDVGRVIVVDNGSTDRTAEIAAQAGAVVVSEPERGYGAA